MRVITSICVYVLFAAVGLTGCHLSKQPQSAAADRFPVKDPDILLLQARAIFGILPQTMPGGERDTPAQVELGKRLFFDSSLSINRTQSCNTCHPILEKGIGADGLDYSPGALGKSGTRNTPTVLNAGYQISQFWDGRSQGLAEQAKGPILNQIEMGMPHIDACLVRIRQTNAYPHAFRAAFPGDSDPITYDNTARALAAFERTLTSRGRFDLFLEGDADALTVREKKGLRIFMNEGCIRCHGGPLLGGMLYQKVGVYHPYRNLEDAGRYAVTHEENDCFVFKVPMLRNVTLTAPYFHDGRVPTLAEAVDEMAWLELDTRFSNDEIDSIVRFLTALADRDRAVAPGTQQMKKPEGWNPPKQGAIAGGEAGELVRYGYQLLTRTPAYLGAGAKPAGMVYTGSELSCSNCHQEEGTKPYGLPWMGVVEHFPQFSFRTDREATLEDRVNDCMERSLNGRSLPQSGREMKAIISYLDWLSEGFPLQLDGMSKPKLNVPDRRADISAGSRVYRQFCQACHGVDGGGYIARSAEAEGVPVVPPLWGKVSFNTGAGMHRLLTSAAFVKGNMPLGTPWDRPVLTDEQAYDVAAYINSRERPRMQNTDKDWPDLSRKPEDCPYPPYADAFTQEQHQFGPFGPIREAKKQKQR